MEGKDGVCTAATKVSMYNAKQKSWTRNLSKGGKSWRAGR